ncbi:DUF2867 domain-containing protein [Candidatus Marinamargulisbacteria bacterium SCGC AG-414-C22]|nr:DUF2867 domain-containing protein [Candidatus Marinamargulisbacteria bacterium SCGC AG-414-C22]
MRMVKKVVFPKDSILFNQNYDYTDSYRGYFLARNQKISLHDVVIAFFDTTPAFVVFLLYVRDRVVSLFGLKTNPQHYSKKKLLAAFKCDVGEALGLFKIHHVSDHEVVLGEDDKHLDFRVSLMLTYHNDQNDADICITTTVHIHNLLGQLYFFPVKFFHRLIVPIMLKRMIKALDQ